MESYENIFKNINGEMTNSNRERFIGFYKKYFDAYISKSGAAQAAILDQRPELIAKIKSEIDEVESGILEFGKYSEEDFKAEKLDQDRKNIITGGQSDPNIYNEAFLKYLDISQLTNQKKFSTIDFTKEMNKFGEKAYADKNQAGMVNKNMYGWERLDPLQDNIGSIKSLVEFFFNFMMCYPAPHIKTQEEFRDKGFFLEGKGDGFYLPLPDEWIKEDGILDHMMDKKNKNYNILKTRGIPIYSSGIGGIADKKIYAWVGANIKKSDGNTFVIGENYPNKKIWDVNDNKDRFLQCPYITQPLDIEEINVGSIGGKEWDNPSNAILFGAYFKPFLSPINTVSDWLGINSGVDQEDSSDQLSKYYLGGIESYGYKDGSYSFDNFYLYSKNMEKSQKVKDGNEEYINVSMLSSNVYRSLYDIIYSNAAFTSESPDASLNILSNDKGKGAGLKFRYGLSGGVIFENKAGEQIINTHGFVSMNGSIPATGYKIPDVGYRTSCLSIPGYYNENFPIEAGLKYYRCTNTARTAYNTILLEKSLDTDINNSINVSKNDYIKFNETSKYIKSLNLDSIKNINAKNLNTGASLGMTLINNNLSKSTPEMFKNLCFANAGCYTAYYNQGNNTPIGLLTSRYNTSADAYGDITEKEPFMDSIPNDDMIEAVIYKFTEMIFSELNPNYLVKNDSDNIKYFAYRLSRAIVVVKHSIFNAPIFNDYKNLSIFEKNDEYFGGSGVSKNRPGTLFGKTDDFNISKSDDLKKKQLPRTFCKNSQPITLSLTTPFRKAFTTMMNKAILCRAVGEFTFDKAKDYVNNKPDDFNKYSAEELVSKEEYYEFIATCHGDCDKLVKLDVSSILEMKDEDSNFYYFDFLKSCLSSEVNIVTYNFNNTLPAFRPSAAGITQLKIGDKYINYDTVEATKKYLDDVIYTSKDRFLKNLEHMEEMAEKAKETVIKFRESKVVNEIKPIMDSIYEGIVQGQNYKVNAGIATISNKFKAALKEYENALKRYDQDNEALNDKLLQYSKLFETNKPIDFSTVETRIKRLYDDKQRILSNFEKTYTEVSTKILVIIRELNKLSERIMGATRLRIPENVKKSISEQIKNIAKGYTRDAELTIPGLTVEFIDRADLEKLSDLDPFRKYIGVEFRGDIWIPIEAGVGWKKLFWKVPKLGFKYKLFNIMTGDTRDLEEGKPITDLNGAILVAPNKESDNWYFGKKPDLDRAKKDKNYLKQYRENLFRTYGQPRFWNAIIFDWVKKEIIIAVDKNIRTPKNIEGDPVIFCRAANRCRGVVYFDDLQKRLLEIIKTHEKDVKPKKVFEKIVEQKNVPLKEITPSINISGGNKDEKITLL